MGQRVQPEMYLNSPVWTTGHEFSVRQATAQRPASATIYILTSVRTASFLQLYFMPPLSAPSNVIFYFGLLPSIIFVSSGV